MTHARFGSAVVVSENLRVVVGAPEFGVGNSGCVFTFQFQFVSERATYESAVVLSATIPGSSADAMFGSDLDISPSGDTLVVGEPGRNIFRIYDWDDDDNSWVEVFRHECPPEYVDFGSSVVFLSSTHVAVGAPSVNNDAGMVSLFQKNENSGTWTLVKSIQGEESGARLGAKGSVSGAQGSWGTQVVVATQKGHVQRHDLVVLENASHLFVKRFSVNVPGPTSVDVEADEDGFVVLTGYGADDLVVLYGLPVESNFSPAPVPSPPNKPLDKAGPKPKDGELISAAKVPNSGQGASVALAGALVVVGQPSILEGAGAAEIFQHTTEWTTVDTLVDSGSEEFGSAMDSTFVDGKSNLVVGAKAASQNRSDTDNYGSAHCFELHGDSWVPVGEAMHPQLLEGEAGGEFGAAVAMSSKANFRRIAVGAPRSSKGANDQDNGRVYTFQYDGVGWQPLTAALIGIPGSFFGFSLDLMSDGSRLLIGAPGIDIFFYYRWNQWKRAWVNIFVTSGETGEAFGSSVAIVVDDGSTIAVGGPAHGDGRGVVRVYSQSSSGDSFSQIGNDIVGSDGERIGTTLCASNGRLAYGTDTGSFHVFEYSGGNWVEVATGPSVGSAVVSIAISQDTNTLVLGLANDEVLIHDLSV